MEKMLEKFMVVSLRVMGALCLVATIVFIVEVFFKGLAMLAVAFISFMCSQVVLALATEISRNGLVIRD